MKYKRTHRETEKEEWLKIADDKSAYTWTDDYDNADSFSNIRVANAICMEAKVHFDLDYNYILEPEDY